MTGRYGGARESEHVSRHRYWRCIESDRPRTDDPGGYDRECGLRAVGRSPWYSGCVVETPGTVRGTGIVLMS